MSTLTDEQKARVEENRRRALERLRERQLENSSPKPAHGQTRKRENDWAESDARKKTSLGEGGSSTNADGKTSGPTCEVCGTPDGNGAKWGDGAIDHSLLDAFGVTVCKRCKAHNEDYDCITKREAMGTYLLPEGTVAVLRFIEKDNPHHTSWNKMKLFLRKQVVEHSHKRWGGGDELQAERKRREVNKYNQTLKRTKGIFKRSPGGSEEAGGASGVKPRGGRGAGGPPGAGSRDGAGVGGGSISSSSSSSSRSM